MTRILRSAGLAVAAIVCGLIGAGLLSAAAILVVAQELGLIWGLGVVAGVWLLLAAILLLAARGDASRPRAAIRRAAGATPAVPIGSLLTAVAAGVAAARGRTDEASRLLDHLNQGVA